VVLHSDRKRGQNWTAAAANLVLTLAQKISQHRLARCGGFTIQGNVQLAHQVGLRILLEREQGVMADQWRRGGEAGTDGFRIALLGAMGGLGNAERFNRAVGDRS